MEIDEIISKSSGWKMFQRKLWMKPILAPSFFNYREEEDYVQKIIVAVLTCVVFLVKELLDDD